jgi:hypothetical protein
VSSRMSSLLEPPFLFGELRSPVSSVLATPLPSWACFITSWDPRSSSLSSRNAVDDGPNLVPTSQFSESYSSSLCSLFSSSFFLAAWHQPMRQSMTQRITSQRPRTLWAAPKPHLYCVFADYYFFRICDRGRLGDLLHVVVLIGLDA